MNGDSISSCWNMRDLQKSLTSSQLYPETVPRKITTLNVSMGDALASLKRGCEP